MLRLLGRALFAVFVRFGSRHVVIRRVLWIAGGVRLLMRRRRQRSQVVSLRPGETLEVSIHPKTSK